MPTSRRTAGVGILMALAVQVDFDKPTNRRTVRVGATVNLRCHVLAVNLVVTTLGLLDSCFQDSCWGARVVRHLVDFLNLRGLRLGSCNIIVRNIPSIFAPRGFDVQYAANADGSPRILLFFSFFNDEAKQIQR